VLDQDQVNAVVGRDVYGSDGDKIGTARQVYVDDNSGRPEWVTVATGLFGTKESFIPLADASVSADQLTVPYTKAFVKDAPNVDEDGHLSPDRERQLYGYYSRADYDTTARGTADDVDAGTTGTAAGDRSGVGGEVGAGSQGYDTSGPTTDDAMTVSEERLDVGTRTEEAGRARLRKYVVTENVTQTVPVSREEVRLEREPITDANRGAAVSGPDISEEEHEVVLHEERPVVQKETVPVERVSLGTETVTEQQTVNEEVRKERVDVDGDGDGDVSRADRT
jgi:uncharacterized protein (TIGR02271 family)